MAQESALHIKLDKKTDEQLRYLASARKVSKGQLVREAITACYQASTEDLSLPQRQALMACQGGYISLGKLAQVMGMHVLDLRKWLSERNINMPSAFGRDDARHA